MKKRVNKEDVIAVGTDLMARNGYTATGIDLILRTAGVPKGSFYHYFGTKEDFGLAVIDQFATEYDKKLDSFFKAPDVAPLQRIRNYFEYSLEHLRESQFAKGCLIGNLGQELADQNERFRERLDVIFRQWRDRFAACLNEARQRGDLPADINPAELAEFLLASWEGTILRAKVMKSPEPIRNFIDIVFASVLR